MAKRQIAASLCISFVTLGWATSEGASLDPAEPSFRPTLGEKVPHIGSTDDLPIVGSFHGQNSLSVDECNRTPIDFTRYETEKDAFALLDCDGSVSSEAIDRLSIMARPINVERPALPLPSRPSADAAAGEWLPSIRLMNPRLVWLLHKLTETFPGHGIYIVSGYRTGNNRSMHAHGSALDLQFLGVSNWSLYRACRKYEDVGCGYYPNHGFVHIDVRPLETGRRFWVDVSKPGYRSKYVSRWRG